jgi:hypothetical protein
MAKCMQCGGATKMKKMQKGGSAEIVGMPKYGNNPRTEQGRILKDGGSIKTTSKSSTQLKREGSAQKAKGVAMKAKGQAMKYEGQQQKNNSLGIVGNLTTRSVASAIKLKESALGSKNRGLNEQKILDEDMSIHRANKARNKNETRQVKEMQNKGGYSKAGFKTGGITKAKFGASVAVQRGYPGKIRSAEAQGYTAVGKREPTRNKFAKGGFPDLNKDGKITKADILKGRGVIKKMGGSIKKK